MDEPKADGSLAAQIESIARDRGLEELAMAVLSVPDLLRMLTAQENELRSGMLHELRGSVDQCYTAALVLERSIGTDSSIHTSVESLFRGLERISDCLRAMRRVGERDEQPRAAEALRRLWDSAVATITRAKGVCLETDYQGADFVVTDGAAVHNILVHLLLNSVEAASRAGIRPLRVTLTAAAREPAGTGLTITCADNGGGLPTEVANDRPQVIFSRGFSTGRNKSGMGLWIAALQAQRAGGELTVTPQPGGCLFRLTTPGDERRPR